MLACLAHVVMLVTVLPLYSLVVDRVDVDLVVVGVVVCVRGWSSPDYSYLTAAKYYTYIVNINRPYLPPIDGLEPVCFLYM